MMAKKQKAKQEKQPNKEEIYVELHAIDDKIKQVKAHLEKVDEQLSEVKRILSVINSFSKAKEGDLIKVPIANGIFFDAKLEKNTDFLVNVGADVLVKKKPAEVEKMLESQKEDLKEAKASLLFQFQQMVSRAEEIQEVFKD